MKKQWFSPVEVWNHPPRKILVLSDDRGDYHWFAQLLLDQGRRLEVLFKPYDQIPEKGDFDLVFLFSSNPEVVNRARLVLDDPDRYRGNLIVVRGKKKGGWPDLGDLVRTITKDELLPFVEKILSVRDKKS